MKEIFLQIQTRLSEIAGLRYINKDLRQLYSENPPVKWPCALIDIASIEYKQMGQLAQQAEADIEITVANLQLTNPNLKNPNKEEAYTAIELLDEIHQSLHGWCGTGFSPLIRTQLQKVDVGYNYEVYRMIYRTTWRVMKQQPATQAITLNPVTVKSSE